MQRKGVVTVYLEYGNKHLDIPLAPERVEQNGLLYVKDKGYTYELCIEPGKVTLAARTGDTVVEEVTFSSFFDFLAFAGERVKKYREMLFDAFHRNATVCIAAWQVEELRRMLDMLDLFRHDAHVRVRLDYPGCREVVADLRLWLLGV